MANKRLVDANEIIDYLEAQAEEFQKFSEIAKEEDEMNLSLTYMAKAIENLKTVLFIKSLPTQNTWIPCSEGLPDKRDNYLCTMEMSADVEEEYKRHVCVGHFNGADRSERTPLWTDDCKWKKTVAWMPLPEPYKGGKNDEEKEH